MGGGLFADAFARRDNRMAVGVYRKSGSERGGTWDR